MNWQERAEAAEAELERLAKQGPVAWLIPQSAIVTFDEDWAHKNPDYCDPLFLAPVAVAAVPEDYRQALVEIALRCTDHDTTDAIDALLQSGSDPVAHHPV